MSGLLPLSFVYPAVLAALPLLAVIWWLLRFTPPSPRRMSFPATRLLLGLRHREETPDRSPWWLTLLRMIVAALVILALAGPVWNPTATTLAGQGPLLIVLDTAWPSGRSFDTARDAAERLLAEAESADRPVILAATATRETEQDLTPKSAEEARERLAAMAPQPWMVDRETLVPKLETVIRDHGVGEATWITDGLETGSGLAFAEALSERLPAGGLSIYADTDTLPVGIKTPRNSADALTVTAFTAATPGEQGVGGVIQARDVRGRVVAEEAYQIPNGQTETTVSFRIPVELRNEIVTLEALGQHHAGAIQLLDDRARRRTVGLISGESIEAAQPLLSPLHYISQALAPYADLREPERGTVVPAIRDLVRARTSVIILADVGTVTGEAADNLSRWIEAGGTLVRFSGPRMAAGADDLVPVRLRRGGRILGGSLSWETPQSLAPLERGPFAGIGAPEDIKVQRQILAEPDVTLPDRTWATLEDGTPLVTAVSRGRGRIVLFHVTADTRWSNLPITGTFVEMLRRVLAMSAGVVTTDEAAAPEPGMAAVRLAASQGEQLLPPLRSLSGRGVLGQPPGSAKPIAARAVTGATASRDHPPGLYGAEDAYRALNLLKPADTLQALDLGRLAAVSQLRSFHVDSAIELKPSFLAGAAGLMLLDAIAVIALGLGLGLTRFGRSAAAVVLGVGLSLGALSEGRAQDGDKLAMAATLETRLAYVVTGNAEIDEVSLAGLRGLTRYLTDRTALEPGDPIGIDPAQDELAFFPLLYWPVDTDAATPAPETLARIDAFMKQGGTILFDTRDQLLSGTRSSNGPGSEALRRMLSGLDIPPLEIVPQDHVLTKAFYLLQDFPGRYSGGPLWVEAMPPESENEADRPARAGDGVSSIMITANDFAAAWAINDRGDPLFPTVPNDPRQREMAMRTGVNIVMYALTGNYKADQVHVPALLERLGQ